MNALLNPGFELVADGTTDPPKHGAYWLGAFSPVEGEAWSYVVDDRPFRGERLLRLSHACEPVVQKIVADPRWTDELRLTLALRTYRGGELQLTLEDGPGRTTLLRLATSETGVSILDAAGAPVPTLAVRAGPADDWWQLAVDLGEVFAAEHGDRPVPRLQLRLAAGGAPKGLCDIDEISAAVAWPAVGEHELALWVEALVRWTLDEWLLPPSRGGLGLVDPATGYVRSYTLDVETGTPGGPEKLASFHSIHTLLLRWMAEARRRGLDDEVDRWQPALRVITSTLLRRHFDPTTGLPRMVEARDGTPSDTAVTVQAFVDFLLDARELLDDAALREQCLQKARGVADALVRLHRQHDLPPDKAPPVPVWNAATRRIEGDLSNWFGHLPDRLTPAGEVETDRRFYTSWAILTGRTFWYELMRSPRALMRVHEVAPRPADLEVLHRAIGRFHRDWDATRYDLENDTDDHYGYLCEDLLALLEHSGGQAADALALVQQATDHRLSREATSAGDTLWVQGARLGTACAGDSPRAFDGPVRLYRLPGEINPISSGLALYRDAILELARNDLQGRQLTNAQFTESFFKNWEMVCICYRGTYQGDCREQPPEYWHGDVGDTFGGPPTSAIDAQTAAWQIAPAWARPEILARLSLIRDVTEASLRRPHGYLHGLDEAIARQYGLPEKYVMGLTSKSAAGLGYVFAWMRLLPELERTTPPRAPAVSVGGEFLSVVGAPGGRVALPTQVDAIAGPVSAFDARMLALDLGALPGGLAGAPVVQLDAEGRATVPRERLPAGPLVVQPLALESETDAVLAIGEPLSLP